MPKIRFSNGIKNISADFLCANRKVMPKKSTFIELELPLEPNFPAKHPAKPENPSRGVTILGDDDDSSVISGGNIDFTI